MLGLNHSHIVGTVYTHKAQGWSENLEELPLQQPPPQFVYKRLSLWHNFPTDARFRVKRHKVFCTQFVLSFSIVTTSSQSALWQRDHCVLWLVKHDMWSPGHSTLDGYATLVGVSGCCGNKLRDKYRWDQVEKQWWNRWVMQTSAALTQTFTKLNEQSHRLYLYSLLHVFCTHHKRSSDITQQIWAEDLGNDNRDPIFSKSVSNHDKQQGTQSGQNNQFKIMLNIILN